MAAYDLVVLADTEARTLRPNMRQWLAAFVQRGGRLLLLGGPYAFGRGGWADDELTADLLPVTLHRNDLDFAGKMKPVKLVPTGKPAAGLDYRAEPLVVWQHNAEAKPGVTVVATAGGKPAIAYGDCGKGKVAVVLVAPLGEVPPGATAFWDWSDWPSLMQGLVRTLLANKTP